MNAPPSAPALAILPPRYPANSVRPPRHVVPGFQLTAALVALSGAVASRDSVATIAPRGRS